MRAIKRGVMVETRKKLLPNCGIKLIKIFFAIRSPTASHKYGAIKSKLLVKM